jgi:hypothetical protein
VKASGNEARRHRTFRHLGDLMLSLVLRFRRHVVFVSRLTGSGESLLPSFQRSVGSFGEAFESRERLFPSSGEPLDRGKGAFPPSNEALDRSGKALDRGKDSFPASVSRWIGGRSLSLLPTRRWIVPAKPWIEGKILSLPPVSRWIGGRSLSLLPTKRWIVPAKARSRERLFPCLRQSVGLIRQGVGSRERGFPYFR